jgi:carbon storage regulator
MLVLARKNGQKIWIGEDIEITVLSHDQGVVRLGITAPKHVAIHREEVGFKILSQGRDPYTKAN